MEQAGPKRGIAVAMPLVAPLVAAFACLQPGIDPVFLTVLSEARPVPADAHGWVVGCTQAGAALGALLVWAAGGRLPAFAIAVAAGLALLGSLATAAVSSVEAVLAARSGYGLAMGVVYARTMASYASQRPSHAYGAVFLIQLVLSTAVSLALPVLVLRIGPESALAAMALVPALALLLLLPAAFDRDPVQVGRRANDRHPVPAAGWALAAATFWFIAATMLVWSFSAALAMEAGIEDATVGAAVAGGSLIGALTALAVMRERLLVPLPVTAVLAGLALASPLVLTVPGGDGRFIAAIALLNIGSTAIIIRCSGLASAASADSRFRVFVACTHSLGLIAGPVLGSLLMALMGRQGLLLGVVLALAGGLISILWAVLANRRLTKIGRASNLLAGPERDLRGMHREDPREGGVRDVPVALGSAESRAMQQVGQQVA